MFNRKQYMNHECTHDEYYSQFVNNAILSRVKSRVGEARIKGSTDPHFNDIPLAEWDSILIQTLIDKKLFKSLENVTYRESDRHLFIWSKCSNTCIAKQAARMIRDGEV
jgi:hypothetical protein